MKLCIWFTCVLTVIAVGCQNTPERDGSIQTAVLSSTPTPTPTQTPTPVLIEPTATMTPQPTPTPNRMAAMEKYMHGSLLLEEGRYVEAANAFLDAYQINPDSALICSYAAKALLLCGNLEQAITFAQQSIQLEPNQNDGYEALAQCYINMQNNEKAAEQYETLLNLHPESLEYMDALADLYVKTGKYNRAIQLFRKIIQKNPQQPVWFHMRLAVLLFDLKRYSEALTEYQYLAAEFSESFEVHFQLGNIYSILNQQENALNSFFTALNHIHSKQDEIKVRKALGQIFKTRNALPETIHQYESIKAIDPQDKEARKELALLYAEQNNETASIQEVEELLQQHPDELAMHELRFDLLMRFGKEKEANQHYLDSLSRWINENHQSNINELLGLLLYQDSLNSLQKNEQLQTLEVLMQQCDDMLNEPVRIHFAQAHYYDWRGNTAQKENHLNMIVHSLMLADSSQEIEKVELICNELLQWHGVRRLFNHQPFYDTLTKALHDCSNRHPSIEKPDRVLGVLALDRQEWNKAETAFKKVMQRMTPQSQEYKDVLFQLAWVYDRMNRLADVEELMEKAQLHFPNDANVYNYLGYLYADRGIHLEKSLALIEKAFKLSPNDANIIDSMGWVYFRLERYQEALDMLKKAYSIDAEHPVIAMHLGEVYHQMGKTIEALPYWKQSLENAADYPDEFTDEKMLYLQEKIKLARQSE